MMSNKGTVLLVEDQEGFRRIYQDVMNAEGYFVITAVDGEAGWEMAKEKKPDLVLLDLVLPKIDGFEVLRRIREDPETNKIPVIVFSAMGEQKDIQKAMEMGANDYTVKGFYTPRQILGKIKDVMTQVEIRKSGVAYKLQVKPGMEDATKLQDEIGLTNGYECPLCKFELVLEMFPDYVRAEGHWFSSRLICPHCGKVA